jgi:uncharacterized protein (TIGR00297 family)
MAAAALLGIACAAAGPGWIGLLLAFYISGTLLTRYGEVRKAARTGSVAGKGSARDAMQVVANGGAFTAAAIGNMILPSTAWMVVGAAAIAASAADTWATEVGTLFSDSPRSITTWREVPPGTSGGVSVPGTAATLAGAAFIAAIAGLAGWPAPVASAAVAGGFTGSVVDSLLGATVQSRRWCDQCGKETESAVHSCGARTRITGGLPWLDNDGVNAISSMAGAAAGALWLL